MIVDVVTYAGEYECLLLRLHELAGVVDYHVLVEAMETFTGLPKPLHYEGRDRARLGALASRVLSCVAVLPRSDDPWARETYQRNMALRLLDARPADTVVLVGDVDEIPSAEAVTLAEAMIDEGNPQLAFQQRLCLYYANNRCTTAPNWYGTQAVRLDWLRRVTPQGVRNVRNNAPYITNAGWHFGSLLGDEGAPRFARKLASFSHAQEVAQYTSAEHIAEAIAAGADVSGRTDILFSADLEPKEEDYPVWLWANRREYSHLFAPGSKL